MFFSRHNIGPTRGVAALEWQICCAPIGKRQRKKRRDNVMLILFLDCLLASDRLRKVRCGMSALLSDRNQPAHMSDALTNERKMR